ncbi:MAG: sigma 54-interacting transcriptional regulator [Clostridiales bacterium]|nr:sigma 54-interacting transcriptional regulator [Clostridiales bacterium]
MDNEQRKYYSRLYPEVSFEFSDPYDPIPLVQQKINEGIEIVAGRGTTAEVIRERFPNIHVVKIQATGYDVIRSLGQTDLKGATVAVITSNVDISGLSVFEQLYSIRIIGYLKIPFAKLENTIRDAVLRGAQYILGGALTCRMANELQSPAKAILLALGPESMSAAIHDIKQVQEAIEIEAGRQGFLNRLLDSIDEGVISVDSNGKITLVNANAARLLRTSPNLAIGKSIDHFFAEDTPDEEDTLININGNQVLVTRTPVKHGNREHGAIYTLHEPSHIESLETHIRRESYIRNSHIARFRFNDIIGQSSALQEAIRISKNYALTDASVLIAGETGSGKEMFAQSIHNASKRRKGAFVAVNCAALPETLLESELFGYVEGAFTGANRKGRTGLFEAAHGGTIFLDEISEMCYSSQGRLLRVLQEKYIVRLGSHKIIPVDVRIIAATNRDLQELVRDGKFRQDLYYRLNVLNLTIPPLRERKGDAIILLKHFLNTYGLDISFSNDAISFLKSYQWYGNVREVNNLADRIAATKTGSIVTRNQIERLLDSNNLATGSIIVAPSSSKPREKKQEEEIMEAIRQANGHMGNAAAILGINRSTLWRRIKKLNLK